MENVPFDHIHILTYNNRTHVSVISNNTASSQANTIHNYSAITKRGAILTSSTF